MKCYFRALVLSSTHTKLHTRAVPAVVHARWVEGVSVECSASFGGALVQHRPDEVLMTLYTKGIHNGPQSIIRFSVFSVQLKRRNISKPS